MSIPRKRFGQHFLRDEAIIDRIVASLQPRPQEHLVEIGPGQGALTLPILAQVKHLDAIELDRDLIPILAERCKNRGDLTIHAVDALDFDFSSLKKDDRALRVFGNLPYNISTPLIFHLLNFATGVSDMLFMLQREVAARLAAEADTPDYGRLSVMVQYHCQVDLLFDVPPNAFYPPPKVMSSIVKLTPYRTFPCRANDYVKFASIVKRAFGLRRKTLRNSLRDVVTDEMWANIPVRSDLRAENLTVNDFVDLSNAL